MKFVGNSVKIRNFLPQWYNLHIWDGKTNGSECQQSSIWTVKNWGIELVTLRKHFQLTGKCSGKKVDELRLQFWQNLCADPTQGRCTQSMPSSLP